MARIIKDSGIKWIGEMPKEWRRVKLGYLYSFSSGTTLTAQEFVEDGLFEVYGANGLRGRYDKSNLCGKHILVGRVGALCGNIHLVEGEIWVTEHALISYKKSDLIIDEFSAYVFIAMNLGQYASGTAQPVIASERLKRLYVPIPPYEEQQCIVSFLNTECASIDSVIEKTRVSIEEYKKLKQSIITRAVTKGIRPNRPMKDSGIEWIGEIPDEWRITKFKNLGKCRNGLTYSPEDQCGDAGTLVLRSSNIQDGRLDYSDCVYVDKSISEELMVKPNDILICSRNGSAKLIGKNALIPEGLNASFGAFMMIYRCRSPKYLQYVLNSDVFSYYLGTFLTVSVNQLTGKNFDNIEFPYTDNIDEQSEIINFLDNKCLEIDQLIDSKQKLLIQLEKYRESLIYEYVTGKKELV